MRWVLLILCALAPLLAPPSVAAVAGPRQLYITLNAAEEAAESCCGPSCCCCKAKVRQDGRPRAACPVEACGCDIGQPIEHPLVPSHPLVFVAAPAREWALPPGVEVDVPVSGTTVPCQGQVSPPSHTLRRARLACWVI